MVQALLTSIRSMLGASASQNKEFKNEAVKNNKNVFSAIKDISRMFSSQNKTDAKQNASLDNIESHTMSTSAKVDRSNLLLQESISLQTQMLGELKSLRSIIANPALQQGSNGQGILSRIATGLATTALIGGTLAGGTAGALQNLTGVGGLNNNEGTTNTNLSSVQPTNFSGSKQEAFSMMENAAREAGSPDPKLTASIAMLESGWMTSKFAQQNNPFGQSITERQIGTEGIVGGRPAGDGVYTAMYEDIPAAVKHHLRRWGDKYTSNPQQTLQNLVQGGYNKVDPSWSSKIYSIYQGSQSNNPEGDETGVAKNQYASLTPSDQNLEAKSSPMGAGGGSVFERQHELAGIRKLPLSDNLKNVLRQAATTAGVDVVVYSGGQAPKGSGGPRTGSTRHDNGNAADLYLMRDGRKLSDTNEEDRAIMAKFVSAAVSAGATGVGAGHGYMGPSNIHVGFGKQATWGGAPWIRQAASGVYNNQDLQAQGGAGSYGGTGTGDGSYGAAGDIISSMAGALSAFGLGGMMGGNILGMLSGFFGMPIGDASTMAAYGVNQQGQVTPPETFNESEEEEPELADRRMEEAPPHAAKKAKEQAAIVESDYPNYELASNEIQKSALNNSAPVVIEKSPQTQPYTTAPMQVADFSTAKNDYPLTTQASWRPRIGVLRPAEPVMQRLTWASKLSSNLA
jgi:hypothetical protein